MTDTSSSRRRSFKVWHLTLKEDNGYGRHTEFIVVTETAQDARYLACDSVKESEQCMWLDPRKSHIEELGTADKKHTEPKVITSVYYGD